MRAMKMWQTTTSKLNLIMTDTGVRCEMFLILVARMRFYKPLCWLVDPSVGWSLFTMHVSYDDRSCYFLVKYQNTHFSDSFIFAVTYPVNSTRNFYRELCELGDCIDFSTYTKNSPIMAANMDRQDWLLQQIQDTKGIIGRMKSEVHGDQDLLHVIALKPKMYSYAVSTGQTKLLAKGVSRYVIRDQLSLEYYSQVLNSTMPMRHSMNTIQSKLHTLYIVNVNKCTLSLFDDKRYWLDKYTSLPYGHPHLLTLR